MVAGSIPAVEKMTVFYFVCMCPQDTRCGLLCVVNIIVQFTTGKLGLLESSAGIQTLLCKLQGMTLNDFMDLIQ